MVTNRRGANGDAAIQPGKPCPPGGALSSAGGARGGVQPNALVRRREPHDVAAVTVVEPPGYYRGSGLERQY